MRSSRSSGSNRSNRFRTDDLNGLNLGGEIVLEEENKLRVAVDIGGTFTDVVVFDEAKSSLTLAKTLSTPAELARGVLEGLTKAAVRFDEVSDFNPRLHHGGQCDH